MSGNMEIEFDIKDMIVSSTDKKGNIVYVNDVLCDIAGYDRVELMGKPHNIIRHPDMPKCIFKLLWTRLLKGEFIYAFVKNRAKNGDYYWVKAYVKPIIKNGEIVSITSYRKPINNFAKEYITKLYAQLIEYEESHSVDESLDFVLDFLEQRNLSYDQFVDRLSEGKSVANISALNMDIIGMKTAHTIYKVHIMDQVKKGNFDVEVTDSCCCKFGKWIDSCKDESFTKMTAWKNVIKYHNKVHDDISQYVDLNKEKVSQNEISKLIKSIDKDTTLIFENLNEVIDNAKE